MQFALWKFSYALHSSRDKRIAFPTPGRHVNLSGTQEGATLEPALSCRLGGTHCSCQVTAYPAVGQELQFDICVPLAAVLDVLVTSYAVLAVKQKHGQSLPEQCFPKSSHKIFQETHCHEARKWRINLHAILDLSFTSACYCRYQYLC